MSNFAALLERLHSNENNTLSADTVALAKNRQAKLCQELSEEIPAVVCSVFKDCAPTYRKNIPNSKAYKIENSFKYFYNKTNSERDYYTRFTANSLVNGNCEDNVLYEFCNVQAINDDTGEIVFKGKYLKFSSDIKCENDLLVRGRVRYESTVAQPGDILSSVDEFDKRFQVTSDNPENAIGTLALVFDKLVTASKLFSNTFSFKFCTDGIVIVFLDDGNQLLDYEGDVKRYFDRMNDSEIIEKSKGKMRSELSRFKNFFDYCVKSFSKAQQEQEQLEQREKLAKEKRELLAREKEKKEKRGRKIGINLRKKPKNMET